VTAVRTVTLDKAALLEVLRDNRTRHRAVFDKAIEGYRERAIAELDARIQQLKARKGNVDLYIRLPEPVDHTRDYDRVIRMVEMHQNDTVELDEDAFAAYVEDDWDWKREFVGTTARYT
jgi:hypothetical protein